MNLNKFTEKAQETVITAQNLATELNHAEVTPEHLLVALLEQSGGVAPSVLRKMALDPAKVAADARGLFKSMPQAYGADVRFSPRMKLVFDSALAEAQRMQDEYVEHGTPAARGGNRGRPLPCRPAPAIDARRDERQAVRRPHAGARHPAHHVAEPGSHLRGARQVRPRPDRARPQGQARSGHRTRRGSPPHDPGALAPHQEQPGVDRRAWRRQDGHRRRSCAADHPRRRAGGAQEQEDLRARHGRPRRRRQVPRRVRGAPQGGAQGDRRLRGADRALHRRAPHRRRRRRRRGRDGRVTDAQADARPRRAAHDRRHDDRRVPQAHREGRGARTPLPAGDGRGADASRTRFRSCAACASATRFITA